MSRALPRGEQNSTEDTAISAIAWELQLLSLLETAAGRVADRYGATALIIDRMAELDSADIRVVIGGLGAVDLWDLDPVLWDDANWAAVRFVAAGQLSVVHPPAA